MAQSITAIGELERFTRRYHALLEFKAGMIRIIATGGLVEAEWRRAAWFRPTKVSGQAMRRRIALGWRLPFGWMMRRVPLQDRFQVGPWWMLCWALMYESALYTWIDWAIVHGLAREPYDGCYIHELEWFPDAPRFK